MSSGRPSRLVAFGGRVADVSTPARFAQRFSDSNESTAIGVDRSPGLDAGPSTHMTSLSVGQRTASMSSIRPVATCRARSALVRVSAGALSGTARNASSSRSVAARTSSRALPTSASGPSSRRSPIRGSRATCSDVADSSARWLGSMSTSTDAVLRAAAWTRAGLICRPAASATMSSSWWASSIMTRSCSGSTASTVIASAYRCRLTTRMSASAALWRAFSARQSSPRGQRFAPGHSSRPTETRRQVRSSIVSSSLRSPVADVVAKARNSSSVSLSIELLSRSVSSRSRSSRSSASSSSSRWRQR